MIIIGLALYVFVAIVWAALNSDSEYGDIHHE